MSPAASPAASKKDLLTTILVLALAALSRPRGKGRTGPSGRQMLPRPRRECYEQKKPVGPSPYSCLMFTLTPSYLPPRVNLEYTPFAHVTSRNIPTFTSTCIALPRPLTNSLHVRPGSPAQAPFRCVSHLTSPQCYAPAMLALHTPTAVSTTGPLHLLVPLFVTFIFAAPTSYPQHTLTL